MQWMEGMAVAVIKGRWHRLSSEYTLVLVICHIDVFWGLIIF